MNPQSEKIFRIRIASPQDARELLSIYSPYVEKTAVSFEWETPSEIGRAHV